jgi:hypothetical protein
MPTDSEEVDGPDKYRGIAENLREIAREVRFERRRAAQLCALADGFERYAERLEREAATRSWRRLPTAAD